MLCNFKSEYHIAFIYIKLTKIKEKKVVLSITSTVLVHAIATASVTPMPQLMYYMNACDITLQR